MPGQDVGIPHSNKMGTQGSNTSLRLRRYTRVGTSHYLLVSFPGMSGMGCMKRYVQEKRD